MLTPTVPQQLIANSYETFERRPVYDLKRPHVPERLKPGHVVKLTW